MVRAMAQASGGIILITMKRRVLAAVVLAALVVLGLLIHFIPAMWTVSGAIGLVVGGFAGWWLHIEWQKLGKE